MTTVIATDRGEHWMAIAADGLAKGSWVRARQSLQSRWTVAAPLFPLILELPSIARCKHPGVSGDHALVLAPYGRSCNDKVIVDAAKARRWQSSQSAVMDGKKRGIRRFQLLEGVE